MPVKELDKLTLADLWKEVKDEESIWGDLKEEAKFALKNLMEATLAINVTKHLKAATYERTKQRQDYRNGSYKRSLETSFGLIENLSVPRCRKTSYDKGIFDSFKRRQDDVEKLIKDMFLAGVSTRRVGETVEPILGFKISAQTVSNILKSLDKEVERFHQRSLNDHYLYLFFDGVVMKAKSTLEVKKRFVLCAYGITVDGKRELIDFCQASSESEACWYSFVTNLYSRGLKGVFTKLITVDGCAGLSKALDIVYPFIPRQRCWVHKLRNVSSYLPRRYQKECLAQAKTIYLAANKKQAVVNFKRWQTTWEEKVPKAVNCLKKDLDELLTFFNCLNSHWPTIRTTNYIERLFREVRKRTRPISTFTNRSSCERIIFGIFCYQNNKWKDTSLKKFTQKT